MTTFESKPQSPCIDRTTAIARIKAGLKSRSSTPWSVIGGRGTAYGWLTITVVPRLRVGHGYLSEVHAAELGQLLGLSRVHQQGVSIAASNDHYREYVARAEGRTPEAIAQPYWD